MTTITTKLTEEQEAALSFYQGDHWQQGKAWNGNSPSASANNSEFSATDAGSSEIKKVFTSTNTVREVVNRVTGSLLYRSPTWTIDDYPEEITQTLTQWWAKQKIQGKLMLALAYALTTSRGYLRLWLPRRFTRPADGGAAPLPGSPAEQLMRLRLEVPLPNQAAMSKSDEDGDVGFYRWSKLNSVSNKTEQGEELVRLDEAGRTLIEARAGTESFLSTPLELGGNLTHYQIDLQALISPQVLQSQRAMNVALTQLPRNVSFAGFPLFVLNNVQPPMLPDGSFAQVKLGPGHFMRLEGLPLLDEQGNFRGYAGGSVQRFEPVDPDSIIKTIEHHHRLILQETQQLYSLIAGDSTASGEARIQAMTDFAMSLANPKAELEAAGSWLLTTLLRLAYRLAGETPPSSEVAFETKPYFGAVPALKQESAINQYQTGLISALTAREQIGLDDPEAEAIRIEQERNTQADPLDQPNDDPNL